MADVRTGDGHFRWFGRLGAAAALVASLAIAGSASAQTPAHRGLVYQADNSLKKVELILNQDSLTGTFGEGHEADIQKYFKKYFFPQWTDPKRATQLLEDRKKLRQKLAFAGRAPSPQVHDALNRIVLEVLEKMAAGDFEVVVRVNGALMIGDLNAVEQPGAKTVPLGAALDSLIKIVDDPKQIDAVKAAAMTGLQRHAGMPAADPDNPKRLADLALRVLTAQAPSPARAEGLDWMRGQAAEIVGKLAVPDADKKIFDALVELVGDSSRALTARCPAAAALGQYSSGQAGAKLNGLTTAIARLALDASKAENQRLVKGRMESRIQAVATGLEGIAKANPAAAENAYFQEITQTTKRLLDALAPDEPNRPELRASQNKLEEALGKAPT